MDDGVHAPEHQIRGKYIIVSFCAQAIGAGGGCAGGDGTYRSRTSDAQGWQIEGYKGWIPLPKN